MEQIREQEPEAFNILEDANVDEETLMNFEREDFKDLFDGNQNFMLRRKLWKILEKARENVADFSAAPSTPKQSCVPFASVSKSSSSMSSKEDPFITIVESPLSKPLAPSSISSGSSRSSSPIPVNKEDTDCYLVTPQKPVFVIYTDSELKHVSKEKSLSDDLNNRLVRSTISNMRAATHNLPTEREPMNDEMEDMAKALCKRFPCTQKLYDADKKEFRDLTDDERSNPTIAQKNQFHISLYRKLKKRRSNITPAKKPQGKVPARSAKRIKLELPQRVKQQQESAPMADADKEVLYDCGVHTRHYNALDKEQRKTSPNKEVINKYLNLEFLSRKEFLQETQKEERPNKIFEAYPCFKDPCEVVEEVRRTLGLSSTGNAEDFMGKSVNTLKAKLDNLIYCGISKGTLKPPTLLTEGNKSSSWIYWLSKLLDVTLKRHFCDGKAIHLIKGINSVFKGRTKVSLKQLKAQEIFHSIEDDKKPDDWQRKRSGFIPGLLVSKTGAALLLGQNILTVFKQKEMLRAITALLGAFYLLDYDYPPGWQASLSVLQNIVFGAKTVHPDVQGDVTRFLNELEKFYSGE